MNILKALKNLFVSIFLLCISTALMAQFEATPVEISKQKTVYQGNIFYVHTVKKGHTLHSICKAYGVSEESVKLANPDISLQPLSIGLTLRIPAKGGTSASAIQGKSAGEDDFILHTVQPKQTIYFLHKKYNVPLDAIYRFNPGSEAGIKVGEIIKIPRLHMLESLAQETPQSDSSGTKYEVRQGETLYSIAKRYNVKVADIVNANAELRWGLKAGQVIVIPGESTTDEQFTLQDSVIFIDDVVAFTRAQCDSIKTSMIQHPPVKVAIMLPFFIEESLMADEIKADSLSPEQRKIKELAQRGRGATEFYEGFLLAVDSLQENNIDMSLFVYDTRGDSSKVQSILGELEIVEPDVIIGPFYQTNVRMVSKFSFEHKALFVPPLVVDDTIIQQNPYFIQVSPGETVERMQYARYLSQFSDKNLVLVYKNDFRSRQQMGDFRQLLLNHLKLKPNFDSSLYNEVFINDTLQRNLTRALRKDTANYVIVFSDYEPDVINVLTQLHFASREMNVRVFGLPAWQTFPNVRTDHYHDLETTFYSPYFIDYYAIQVKKFIKQSRKKLGYEPFKTSSSGNGLNYTFFGYDVGYQFINAVYQYNDQACDCLSYMPFDLLLSRYHYSKNSLGGNLENQSINIIRYTKGYEIVKEGYVGD